MRDPTVAISRGFEQPVERRDEIASPQKYQPRLRRGLRLSNFGTFTLRSEPPRSDRSSRR
jgi:hypothetical protein